MRWGVTASLRIEEKSLNRIDAEIADDLALKLALKQSELRLSNAEVSKPKCTQILKDLLST